MEEFSKIAFNILDSNALSEILIRLNPISVINLCQSNIQFAKVCQNPEIFRRLMKAHYPNIPITNNPKAQYVELTGSLGVEYYIRSDMGDTMPDYNNIAYLCNGDICNDSQILKFRIRGTKIRTGEKLWIRATYDPNQVNEKEIFNGMVYFTKEDSINTFLDDFYEILRISVFEADDYRQWLNNSGYIDNDRRLQQFLDLNAEDMGLPVPYTRENVFNYITENGFYFEDPLNESSRREPVYQFFEFTVGTYEN